MYSLGHDGNRTNGFMIGNRLVLSFLSNLSLSRSSLLTFTSLCRSTQKAKLEPANKLDLEFRKCDDSFGCKWLLMQFSGQFFAHHLTLNKLPQLMRRVAAGEQFKNFICSGSRRFVVKPEWRRSFSLSNSFTVKLGEWLECRRISVIRWANRCSEPIPISGDGGSTMTLTCGNDDGCYLVPKKGVTGVYRGGGREIWGALR